MSTVLAIDQGTSGTKALVTDPGGVVVGIAECPVRPTYLPGGGVEQDPQALLNSVLDTGRRALQAAGRRADVVSLANQGETVLAWDPATGDALSQAVVWQDRRAETVVTPLHHARAWVAQRTGLVLDSYFSAPKMAWLRRNRTREGVVTTTDTWLLHRLTNEFVTDVSTASRSLLTDLDTVGWDDELLSLFDLGQERLPRIAACDEIVGTTGAFGDEVPVGGLMVDQQAALLAQGATSAGQAKCTFGTGAFLLVNTEDRAVRSGGGLSSSAAWRLRGETAYCLDGQVFTAAAAVRWLIDVGLLQRVEDIDTMDAAASGEPTDDVLCVPALAGLGAPWWRSDATASFVGISLSTRREDLVRAVVYGIAAQLGDLATVVGLDTGAPLVRLRVDGGLVRCQTLMQATADLLGVPVDVYPSSHATALGAAAAGRLAGDPSLSVSRAVPAWTPTRSYEPRWSADRSQQYRPVAGHGRGHARPGAVVTGYDVAVIGAGVVGAAIARELCGYELSVTLVEARDDVGDGTSKANTAILHTGFDATPGTLESRLVRRGRELLADYSERTGIPVERTGALMVAWTVDELETLPLLADKARGNGYDRCVLIDADEVYRQVPALGPGALGGLIVPDESIICTWTATLALATDAHLRGVALRLGHRVAGVRVDDTMATLETSAGPVSARWVVNAAGLGSDVIDRMYGFDRVTVTPRRGELFVFDKLARPLVERIVLPVPSAVGKGVLISPTIYGNVMLGPTAEDLDDRTATGTSAAGFEFLLDKGNRLMPRLLDEEMTASYAGLRAAIDGGDYLIEVDPARRYVLVAGIRSTGLSSAMGIAEHVTGLLRESGLALTPRDDVPAPPRMPNIGEAFLRPYAEAERISADPEYGRIVCFCERVTAGEIRDAFASELPPRSVEGLRRRTRVMNGRCQGFYCGAAVGELMAHAPGANTS